MKAKYVVYNETGHDEETGETLYSRVKTFKNEPEALDFIDNPKNLYMYGELFLELHSPDGTRYDWDSHQRAWIENK